MDSPQRHRDTENILGFFNRILTLPRSRFVRLIATLRRTFNENSRLTPSCFCSARFMADPNAINCNFEGNPLHEEQLEIVGMLGGALALNSVVDEERRLSFVNFGEIVASHLAVKDQLVRNQSEIFQSRLFVPIYRPRFSTPTGSNSTVSPAISNACRISSWVNKPRLCDSVKYSTLPPLATR